MVFSSDSFFRQCMQDIWSLEDVEIIGSIKLIKKKNKFHSYEAFAKYKSYIKNSTCNINYQVS